MLDQIQEIVIVVGCQRSGTTLLGQVLGAPEHALLLDESDVVSLKTIGGYEHWLPEAISNKSSARPIWQSILGQAQHKYQPNHQRIRHKSGVFFPKENITQLILKAPNLTYSFNDIARLKIPIRVVYAVRHPRAVVASMLRLSHINFVGNQLNILKNHQKISNKYATDIAIMGDDSVAQPLKNLHLWRVKSDLFSHFEALNIPCTLSKYEYLTSSPEKTCKRIASDLNLRFDELMLTHQNVYKGIAQGNTDRQRAIDTLSHNKWKANSNLENIMINNSAVKETLSKLGY